ncbi:transmembrane protein [Thraustotheca clavata]|uniref:Transmembrane protein n=1 Tax=Thraustotheca clavata TaxID=74557 RepID=A0A1W0A2H9_9STRA|nr:transmembrane protein [Thraustotheca clavata]
MKQSIEQVPPTSSAPYVVVMPSQGIGTWKAGTCGFWDNCLPNGCMAFLCPCVSVAQISSRVGLQSFKSTLIGMGILYTLIYLAIIVPASLESWSAWDYGVFMVYALAAFILTIIRGRIRIALQIPGNTLEDCFQSCCCHCCAIAQLATQVESYNPSSCSFAPKDTLRAYIV